MGILCLLERQEERAYIDAVLAALSTQDMYQQFAQDLRLARRKAGLVQSDLAHLLETTTREISAFENGSKLPSLPQICELSLVYGRSFEALFAELMERGKTKIRHGLLSLPDLARNDVSTFNRRGTLQRIERRVSATNRAQDDAA